ncbi:MAG: hypothetical protein A3F13_02195 [Gammaproteobacteria bacterium RIFCSPHIGHO2_12_FULL_40_19]|nr:MAG: hypothetical protein A3F13_02195 [Gammaproteobacteria bacterium RIFCSPHIGHO2_12_FULL_40_19]
MHHHLKKSTYFLAVFFVSCVLVLLYNLFFDTSSPATPEHTTLALTPFTESEQKALITAQEQEAASLDSGPLVAKMDAKEAQARVLNLNHAAKQESEPKS